MNRLFRSNYFPLVFSIISYNLFFPAIASAMNLAVSWYTVNDPRVAGYKIFYRQLGGAYEYSNPAWKGPGTIGIISGLDDNTVYCFVVRCYDNNGGESANSDELCFYPPKTNTNSDPYQPRLATPVNGELNVSLTPNLETEDFSDPDIDDKHTKTQWQIVREHDDFIVLDVTDAKALTVLTVPGFVLEEDTSYYWRVRFYDRFGAASSWSEASSFVTAIKRDDLNGNGIPDSQEVDSSVDINQDDTPDSFQLNIKSIYTKIGGGQIGLSFEDSTTVTAIEAIESVDPESINDNKNRPQSLPLGLINFKLRVRNPGDLASVIIHLSEPAPSDARWYKYDSINGWQDFSEKALFGANRKSVTVKLKDGGFGDADGIENGLIIDPSGFGITTSQDPLSSAGESGGSGGCFISVVTNASGLEYLANKLIKIMYSLF